MSEDRWAEMKINRVHLRRGKEVIVRDDTFTCLQRAKLTIEMSSWNEDFECGTALFLFYSVWKF